MTWNEVRKQYPEQFVKFEVLKYHEVDSKRYVDDIAVMKILNDNIEAMKEFAECKSGEFVYSTKHTELVIKVVKHIGIRRIN